MLNTLRRKFVLYAMLAITVVMGALVGAINISYRIQMTSDSDGIINFIADHDGYLPIPSDEEGAIGLEITPEKQISTRFFAVKLAGDGEVGDVNLKNTISQTEQSAVDYAKRAVSSSKKRGIMDNMRFGVIPKDYGNIVVFVDFSMQSNSLKALFIYSMLVLFLSLMAVFFMLTAVSSRVVMPVVESIEKQKQFITNAGHELKTPLAIINANSEVLEMMYEKNEWIISIKNQTKRLDMLIKSMLKLSRVEEGGKREALLQIDLSQKVKETAQSFIGAAADRKLTILAEEGVLVKADEDCVCQLTSILLDNAIKYTEKGEEIEVEVIKTPKTAELWVSNTGAELSPDDTERIFERFYRAETSRARKTGGYGIGLSIAKSIMDYHNGRIFASCKDNKITFKAVFNR